MVDSVSVRFKNAHVEKVPLNICVQCQCGSRLRVGVRAKNASVSGLFVCRPFSGLQGKWAPPPPDLEPPPLLGLHSPNCCVAGCQRGNTAARLPSV